MQSSSYQQHWDLFIDLDYKGDMKADRNGAMLTGSPSFPGSIHAQWQTKLHSEGNQSKHWWPYDSITITLCSHHLLRNDYELKQKNMIVSLSKSV